MESRRTAWFFNLLRKLWMLPVRVVDAVALAADAAVRIVTLIASVAIRTVMAVAALPVLLPLLLLDSAFKSAFRGFQKIKQQHSLVAQSRMQKKMSESKTKKGKELQADSPVAPQADAAVATLEVPQEVPNGVGTDAAVIYPSPCAGVEVDAK